MYSVTFCIRFLLPERHQRKPAVQAASAMLRTPPVDGQSPASQPRPLPIYGAQFLEHPRHLPVSGQQCSQTLPSRPFALCRHIAGWTQPCHSNATRAPIANPPNSAQLGGSLYHAPKLHPGLCSSVGVGPRTDRQTHRRA